MNIKLAIGWIFNSGSHAYDFFCKTWKVSENKSIEIQITCFKHKFDLVGLRITYYPKTDHTPFNFEFTLLNIDFIFTFYDHRHWNDDKKRYCFSGEQDE